jgi:hypothetical protein
MEINIAIRIALASIAKEQRRYAFDASLAKRGIGSVFAARALKKWNELEKAKEVLKQWKSN